MSAFVSHSTIARVYSSEMGLGSASCAGSVVAAMKWFAPGIVRIVDGAGERAFQANRACSIGIQGSRSSTSGTEIWQERDDLPTPRPSSCLSCRSLAVALVENLVVVLQPARRVTAGRVAMSPVDESSPGVPDVLTLK
jgi:hypothetical protein